MLEEKPGLDYANQQLPSYKMTNMQCFGEVKEFPRL